MGNSKPQIPNANLTAQITARYNYLADLQSKNKNAEEIRINYKRLDDTTKGELKDAIAKVAHNYSYPSVTDPGVKVELERLFKENMSYSVKIDYTKLKTEYEGVNVNDYAVILRSYIQDVLDRRKSQLYSNMIMNPTI